MDTSVAADPEWTQGVVIAPGVATLIERAALEFETDPRAAREYISRASALLRAERVARGSPISCGIDLGLRGGLAQWQLRRVLQHIDTNIGSRIRAADLATLARLSPSHFNRSFKVTAAVAPFAYITSRRIELARDLMANTGDDLCDIAMACGMADQSHFCRVFRRYVGVSPGVWRRNHLSTWMKLPPAGNSSRMKAPGAALARRSQDASQHVCS